MAALRSRALLCVAAALYAVGLSLCVAAGRGLGLPLHQIAGMAAGCAVLLCAALYNKKTMFATAAALALGAVLWFLLRREDLAEDWLWIGEQAGCAVDFLLRREGWQQGNPLVLAAALGGAWALFAAVVAFRLRWGAALALVGLMAFMLEWGAGGKAAIVGLMPAFAACAAVLAMSVRGKREKGQVPQLSLWQNGLIALLAGALCAGGALLMVPRDTLWARAPSVERLLDGANDVISDLTGYTRPHYQFSIGSMGFMPLGDRLGGPVELGEETVLLVSTTSPRLLRGSVRNFYTGQSWTSTIGLRTYLLGNPLVSGRQAELLDQDLPPQELRVPRFGSETRMSVQHLGYFSNTMFAPGRVHEVVPQASKIIVNFDEKGELFAKRPLEYGAWYDVRAFVPNAGSLSFERYIESLYEEDLLPPDTQRLPDRMYIHFLHVYEDIPAMVGETAREVTQGAENDFDKAVMLRDYLRGDSFTYTLEPDEPPEDADFVAHFLQTREGYCTYFATAMAVMAREVGLPSRYVEGFLLTGARYTENGYAVRENQAHAWTEIYIRGIGWLPFDATPLATSPTGDTGWRPPTYLPEDFDQQDDYIPDEGAAQGGGGLFAALRIPIWVWPIAAAVALAAALAALWFGHHRRWEAGRVLEKNPDPAACMDLIWGDTLKILSQMGFPLRDGQTPLTYAQAADEAFENPEGKLLRVAEAVTRARYGGIAPSERELLRALDYRGEAEEQLKKAGGRARFFLRRVLQVR